MCNSRKSIHFKVFKIKLILARSSKDTLPSKMGRLIPDDRTQCLVRHSYKEMVCQRVNQILCGYEDANDCDRLRGDSALKMWPKGDCPWQADAAA